MSIDSALKKIVNAEDLLKETTIAYPVWKKRADSGYYKDVSKTKWWQALNNIDRAQADLKAAGPLVFLFGDK